MKLIEFTDSFPDEASCKSTFKRLREQEGVVCKRCKNEKHYWLKSKELYECKSCHFRMSLKSGTVMENSKLSYQYWFIAFHLLTATKKTISALEMQRQIGHKYYEPIWAMMHKIRRIMGKRDEAYILEDNVELDEGFYSIGITLEINEFTGEIEELKRGKGSQKKAKVLVMASFDKITPNKHNPKKYKTKSKVKYLKMKVIEDLEATTIHKEVEKSIAKSSVVVTDDYKSYKKLPEIIKQHTSYNMKNHDSEKVLPWVHKAITNSKNLLKSAHHCVWPEYLQNYLDEFCYKYNRRYFGERVFDRLLIAAVSNAWY
jgi:hypothetical protein